MERNKIDFKPFDRVLVRDEDHERWRAALYDQYVTTNGAYPHHVIGGGCFIQCIPYEGNEHLLGKTNGYVPGRWKPRNGERYYSAAWGHSVGFTPTGMIWHGGGYDEAVWNFGDCFRTEEEARRLCDRLNEAVRELMTQNDDEYEADED